jgi:hypothetical protein
MKRTLIAASVISMLAGVPALAQTSVVPSETIVVEPEQRTLIKEYVVKEKVPAWRTTETITVGQPLPRDVELRPVPPTWGPKFTKYRYVYSGDHVYLVEPSNRTVVQVID